MTWKKILLGLIVGLLSLSLPGCQPETEQPGSPPGLDRGNANPRDASLNHVELSEPGPDGEQFLVVGHLYGTIQGEDNQPAPGLLNALPELNRIPLSLLVSLGDMVKQSEADDFDELDRQLLKPAAFPVFNTVGNHDVENRALYEDRYGPTYFSFRHGPSRMIFLDTEREHCAIDSPQREMLNSVMQEALEDRTTRQIFIFMHKTFFFKNDRLFELKAEKAGPNVWDCYGTGNFSEIMQTIIQPAALQKPVYLFAGDVGAYGNLSPYYEKLPGSSLTLVMTGLGDFPSDSGILVTVKGDDVQLEAYSLTGNQMNPLPSYSPEYWIHIAEGK